MPTPFTLERDSSWPTPPWNASAIARYLEAHGRTPGDELAKALGMTAERFWPLINHPWFDITGTGWEITDRGRKEANLNEPD